MDEPALSGSFRDLERAQTQRSAGEGGQAAHERSRPLSREEIDRSPAFARRYASEYSEALRLVPDRDLAKQIARVNLSAKVRGDTPLVTRAVVRRLGVDGLTQALQRDGRDLLLLRGALGLVSVVSRSIEHGLGRER